MNLAIFLLALLIRIWGVNLQVLPYALVGFLSVVVFFFFLKRSYSDRTSSYGAFILAILPWHVQESRTLSLGIVLFFIILVLANVGLNFLKKNSKIVSIFVLALAGIIFCAGILQTGPSSQIALAERNLIFETRDENANQLARLFSHSYVQSYRFRLQLVMENLDPGIYFFRGHPRERLGIEESLKLQMTLIPFLIFGFSKATKKDVFLPLSFFVLGISVLSFLDVRSSDSGLILLLPILLLIVHGVDWIMKNNLKLLIGMTSVLVLESVIIMAYLFSNLL